MKLFIFILLFPFILLPSIVAKWLGAGVGKFYCFIDRRHYREVVERMKICFQKPEKEIHHLAKLFYRHLGILVIELFRMPFIGQRHIQKLVSDKNVDVLKEVLQEGKGCIVVTGHFANWEYAGLAIASYGLPACPVAKPLKDSDMNRFFNSCRQRTGAVVIGQQNAYKELLRALRENKMVIMLLDYDTSPEKGGIFVPFFNRLASTIPTAAILHLKTQAPIVVSRLKRDLDEVHFSIEIDQIIRGSDKDSKSEQIIDISTKINESFERFITDSPPEWLWFQRRWRFDPNKLQNANSLENKK